MTLEEKLATPSGGPPRLRTRGGELDKSFTIPVPLSLAAGQSVIVEEKNPPDIWDIAIQPQGQGLLYIYPGRRGDVTSAHPAPWVLGPDIMTVKLPGAWVGAALTLLAVNGPVYPVVVARSKEVDYEYR